MSAAQKTQGNGGISSRSSTLPAALEVMACSYCEQHTTAWCPECFGCERCCPTEHEHCETCGQSVVRCEATRCGGMANKS